MTVSTMLIVLSLLLVTSLPSGSGHAIKRDPLDSRAFQIPFNPCDCCLPRAPANCFCPFHVCGYISKPQLG